MSLFNIFKGSNKKSSMSFYSFYLKMVKWGKSNVYPFRFNLSDVITLPSDFWAEISKIYSATNTDGKERAISLFWVDGELLVTSVVQGDEKSVISSHNVSVKYEPHPTRKGYYRKIIMENGKTIKKIDVYYKKVPKKVSVEYLFNMHTHPSHTDMYGNKIYSFFSLQDINTLLSSKAIVTGLVTDKLWLLVRTSDTPSTTGNITDSHITQQYLQNNLSLVVYQAEFNKDAIKQSVEDLTKTIS